LYTCKRGGIFYGFFINGIKGREFSGPGFKFGADPLNDKYVNSTCDVRITEAISSLPYPTKTEDPKPTSTQEIKSTNTPEPRPSPQSSPISHEIDEEEEAIWDFKDGYIYYDWEYWVPDYLKFHVGDSPVNCNNEEIICKGWDLSWFGIESVRNDGLNISKINYITGGPPIKVGLSRIFPVGKDKLQIEFVWDEFKVNYENPDPLKFLIGFIDSQDSIENGSFIEFYFNNELSNPNIKRIDGSNDRNYVGFSSYTENRTIFIDCDLKGKLSATCTFYIDGDDKKTQKRDIQFPDKWDSLYIGYELPNNGSIIMKLTKLDLFQEN